MRRPLMVRARIRNMKMKAPAKIFDNKHQALSTFKYS
jgi:hypothetical protein